MISAPFELLQLPKSQASKDAVDPAHDFPVCDGTSSVFVGVPGSSIYKLGVKPPQVLGAHSVAPGTRVSALVAEQDSLRAFSTVERGRFFLKSVAEDGQISAQTETAYETKALYILNDLVVAVDAQSQFTCYKQDPEAMQALVLVYSASNQSELVYSQLLYTGEHVLSVLTVVESNSKVLVKTWSVDSTAAKELTSSELPTRALAYHCYDSRLYAAECGALRVYNLLPAAELVSTCQLDADVRGVCALGNNCAAVCRSGSLDLIDCVFGARVASQPLLMGSTAYLLRVCEPLSTAVVVNSDKLAGLTVSLGLGTLMESLGRGVHRNEVYSLPLTSIFDFSKDPVQTGPVSLANAESERDAVLTSLKQAISARDGPAFARVVAYLKNPAVSFNDVTTPASLDEQVYEETDRVVDRSLVAEICKLAFLPRFKPFVPINVAVYLLTHPLFPSSDPLFTNFLRSLEKSDRLLYRQAVASMSGVKAEDLVSALTSLDEQTFLYAAERLQEDFGEKMVLHALRTTFQTLPSLSLLSALVRRLARYPSTFGLLAPVIDAMGLLGWQKDDVLRVKNKVLPLIAQAESSATVNISVAALLASAGYNFELEEQETKTLKRKEPKRVPKYSVETLVMR